MEAKSCSRSQGQPPTGLRRAAMISIRRAISRDGCMGISEQEESYSRRDYQLGACAEQGSGAQCSFRAAKAQALELARGDAEMLAELAAEMDHIEPALRRHIASLFARRGVFQQMARPDQP